jgi:uncharacterized membrane protein YeaQ/YmgE (transglycosylase-associated protein family)
MSLISTLLVGLVVGALAKFLMPGKQDGGIFVTMLVGVGGSMLATYVGQALGWYRAGQGAGWIASILGAIVVLWVYERFIVPRRRVNSSKT